MSPTFESQSTVFSEFFLEISWHFLNSAFLSFLYFHESNIWISVNRVFLADKELNIVSYSIELSVLRYQTAVMREDFDTANEVLPGIPKESRARVAHFLEKQGFKKQALAVTTDPEHQFDLALQVHFLIIRPENNAF